MGFQGKFRDLSLVDILQVVQMTQKSGVLEVFEGERHASIYFRGGNIVDARPAGVGAIGDDLEARGVLAPEMKVALAGAPTLPGETAGQKLVRIGAISEQKLREVLVSRVEAAVYESISWVNGHFSFDFDAAESTGGTAPSVGLQEVLPGVNFNTQHVLMEALRVFDERRANRGAPAAGAAAEPEHAPAPVSPSRIPRLVVAGPPSFQDRVRLALMGHGIKPEEHGEFADAFGAISDAPAQPVLVVVDVDRLSGKNELADLIGRLQLLARSFAVISVGKDPAFGGAAAQAGAYAHVGLSADRGPALAYLQTLVAGRLQAISSDEAPSSLPRAEPGRPLVSFAMEISGLKDRLDHLADEVHTSSVTMKILEFVAERLDRGLLFLVRADDLQGIGAFGTNEGGDSIGPLVSGLRVDLASGSEFRRAIDGRQTVLCDLGEDPAAKQLYDAIGRPHPADALLLPLTTSESVVALIYADNGFTGRPIADVGELDVLAKQAGLVLENSLLRRLLDKAKR